MNKEESTNPTRFIAVADLTASGISCQPVLTQEPGTTVRLLTTTRCQSINQSNNQNAFIQRHTMSRTNQSLVSTQSNACNATHARNATQEYTPLLSLRFGRRCVGCVSCVRCVCRVLFLPHQRHLGQKKYARALRCVRCVRCVGWKLSYN